MGNQDQGSRFQDTPSGYGWISIALHWLTAVIVIALLFIGSSIESAAPEDRGATLLRHTSLALLCYPLLWYRIVWRFAKGHPGPLRQQRRSFFLIGKYVHLATLLAMACMLVSGPLMVWSGGESIGVLDWFEVPTPMAAHPGLRDFLHFVHSSSAIVIVIGILLHVGGVYKHAAFDQDGTFGKMLVAAAGTDVHPTDASAGATPSQTSATVPRGS